MQKLLPPVLGPCGWGHRACRVTARLQLLDISPVSPGSCCRQALPEPPKRKGAEPPCRIGGAHPTTAPAASKPDLGDLGKNGDRSSLPEPGPKVPDPDPPCHHRPVAPAPSRRNRYAATCDPNPLATYTI